MIERRKSTRCEVVSVALSIEEANKIYRIANEQRISVSRLLRNCLIEVGVLLDESTNKGVTYLIRDTQNHVKVGVSTTDACNRIRTLQTATPYRLTLALQVKGNFEGRFMREFAHLRVRGEWFTWDERMVDFLKHAQNLTV